MHRQGANSPCAGGDLLWSARPNRRLEAEVAHCRAGARLMSPVARAAMPYGWPSAAGRVTGVDLSDVALAKARQLAAERGLSVDWVCADVREYAPRQGHGGPQDPAILFTPEDVTSELGGLTIQPAQRVRRPVTLERGQAHAIDALVRATKPLRPEAMQTDDARP